MFKMKVWGHLDQMRVVSVHWLVQGHSYCSEVCEWSSADQCPVSAAVRSHTWCPQCHLVQGTITIIAIFIMAHLTKWWKWSHKVACGLLSKNSSSEARKFNWLNNHYTTLDLIENTLFCSLATRYFNIIKYSIQSVTQYKKMETVLSCRVHDLIWQRSLYRTLFKYNICPLNYQTCSIISLQFLLEI